MVNLSERYGPWVIIAGGSEGVGVSFARKLGPLIETAETGGFRIVYRTAGFALVSVLRPARRRGEGRRKCPTICP
jgi:threonine/homoserine efflux transporter RhtA